MGEYQDFPSKISCLPVPKSFIVEPFSVSLTWGTEKIWKRGGEYQEFRSKIICLTVPKTFLGEPLSVSLILGTQKFGKEGVGE